MEFIPEVGVAYILRGETYIFTEDAVRTYCEWVTENFRLNNGRGGYDPNPDIPYRRNGAVHLMYASFLHACQAEIKRATQEVAQ